MRGIFGIIPRHIGLPHDADLRRIAADLRHRGRHSWGIWSAPVSGAGVGNARLAIIDLCSACNQLTLLQRAGLEFVCSSVG